MEDITDESAWIPILQHRAIPVSTLEYWTVYTLSAFQAERNEDFDGEVTATKGIGTHKDYPVFGVPPYGAWGSQYTGMSMVFAEALRDGFSEQAHRITVAHEMAHTLGIDHTDGLMHETQQTNEFWAKSLRELREYDGP